MAGGAVAQSSPPDMISIPEYLTKNDAKSVAAKQFIYMRCAAVYSLFGGASLNAGEQGLAAQYNEAAAKMLGAAVSLEPSQNRTARIQDGAVFSQVQKMGKLYLDRASEARARTGSFSDDAIIKTDSAYCKGVRP